MPIKNYIITMGFILYSGIFFSLPAAQQAFPTPLSPLPKNSSLTKTIELLKLHKQQLEAEQEEKHEEEIKEAESSTQLQLLTIFLDDSEAKTLSEEPIVTKDLINALHDNAGPILASSSLLYNTIDYITFLKEEEPELATFLTKIFINNKDWLLKEIVPGLSLLIPRSMIHISNDPTEQDRLLGLKFSEASPISLHDITRRYENLSPNEWQDVIDNTGTLFADALQENRIFDPRNQNIKWVIYLAGHGSYRHTIASIDIQTFPLILHYFNNHVNVALFMYNSCLAAGFNAAQVYGELKKAGEAKEYLPRGEQKFSSRYLASNVKEYSFPIITQAIADAETANLFWIYFINNQWIFYKNFKGFIDELRSDKKAYEPALTHIIPDLGQKYRENIKVGALSKGNLPQIKPPYSPAWFPIIRNKNIIVRINETMALTRDIQKPLIIGESVKTVLLDTDYVPFTIEIDKNASPDFIITLPGDAEVYLEKMIYKSSSDWSKFLSIIGLSQKKFYKEHKYLYIKELILGDKTSEEESEKESEEKSEEESESEDEWDFAITSTPSLERYTDVIIDFSDNSAYYTNKKGATGRIGHKTSQWHYRYPNPEAIKAKQEKYQAFEKLKKTITKKSPAPTT